MDGEETIRTNKFVEFTYEITDLEGNVVEKVDIPISYVHGGYSELLPILERSLKGHRTGDVVEVEIPPEQGFGPHRPELTFSDDIDNVPPQFRQLGAEVEMQNEQGEAKTFRVTAIENGKLTVDANHPFAGKVTRYRVKVLSVRGATDAEKATGGAPPSKPTLN